MTASTQSASKLNPAGLGYVPAVPVKGEADSTTYSAIADSIITTTKEKTEKEIVLTEKKVRIQDAILQYESINKKQETLNKLAEEIKKYLNHARIIKEKNEILQNKNGEIIEFLKQHENADICINECRNKKQQTEEKY